MSVGSVADLDRLKAELAAELRKDGANATRIIQLSNQIAALDQDSVRFTADAAVIRRLGRELVGRQETALAELIKNAYDADAAGVEIRFVVTANALSSIDICDDGNGMTRVELVEGFMRLASARKVQEPRSPRYDRRRAGRKGIGRFASERLGDVLVLTTKTAGAGKALQLTIDWRSFEQGVALNEIETSVVEVDWDKPQGTQLQILEPRDRWTQAQIDRVFRLISALLQPFKALAPATRDTSDPGFLVTFIRRDAEQRRDVTAADINSEIFQHAFAFVEAKIAGDGKVTWCLSSERYELPGVWTDFVDEKGEPVVLSAARDAQLRAYYYVNRSDLFPSMVYGMLKPQLDAHGGIRLYRNSFRVLPYGEPEDDWLRLDELESRRIHRQVSLANRNFLGSVEIEDDLGERFEETSSREGLIENLAFTEMRDTFSAILVSAARNVAAARLRAVGGGSLRPSPPPRTEDVLQDAREAVERLTQYTDQSHSDHSEDGSVGGDGPRPLPPPKDDVDKIAAGLAEASRLLQERAMLRTLASLGLTVAEFTHEFKHQSQYIELTLDELRRIAPTGIISQKTDDLAARIEGARDFSAYFGEMVSDKASRVRAPVPLYLLAQEFRDGVAEMLKNPWVDLKVDRPTDYDIYSVPMFRAEWSSILMNLLTNALKAIRRQRIAGCILIKTGFVDPQTVFLEFADNGDGIPLENRARIFDAFFSTTGSPPAGAIEYRHELGAGLGLKIVRDIVDAVGGTIEVAEPPDGFSTNIRIEVPAATAEDLADD